MGLAALIISGIAVVASIWLGLRSNRIASNAEMVAKEVLDF